MNRYSLITFFALLALVIAFPLYGVQEQQRLALAQRDWRDQLVGDATNLYLDNCAACHGLTGEGVGANPQLNTPELATADFEFLYHRIGHSPHGTAMGIWHLEEGGALNNYQIEALVTLIRAADWQSVAERATVRGLTISEPASTSDKELLLQPVIEADPHRCAACHEEPTVHAELFGLDCARCHTLEAWEPALLVRHVFSLNHGDTGVIACQTCHIQSYTQYTCYGCHDHRAEQMPELHVATEAADLTDCASCHPSGNESDLVSTGK